MSQRHEQRATELLAHSAAAFINQESSGASLITVTKAIIHAHGDHATVFVTVFPEEETRTALLFLNRLSGDFRDYLHKETRLNPLPKVEFMLEDGTSNLPVDRDASKS